jgi:putative endonuclease
MASRRNGTLYIGVTSDVLARVWQHKNGVAEGFSRRYRTHILVWYEMHSDIREAIAREKKYQTLEQGLEDSPHRSRKLRLERPQCSPRRVSRRRLHLGPLNLALLTQGSPGMTSVCVNMR